MTVAERDVLKVVCAQSVLACVLVPMSERESTVGWQVGPPSLAIAVAAARLLGRLKNGSTPRRKPLTFKVPPNLSDAAFNLLNL